ncbi:methyltransferase domain-containing protein [Streptomyces gobiensis]|uniref:methyltransferase domain-containing protein n=1 Tax=Streptomyces gobiensis TaxID=2875706 RepID=UPI001E29E861|nr:methyltransferase domain-containing protein [Streptomyces gobiensis]UGY92898.1 methyltransferase domain-containing protein [Streptomyces gobiensis]
MTDLNRLVEILENKRALPKQWAQTVGAVDRALFIPAQCPDIDRVTDEQKWLRTVYGDLPVVTQVDDGNGGGPGVPTSSSSQPSLMLDMLGLLEVEEGHRVLEIGTATGYHAAWLCHQLGDANVTTVEVDSELHHQARRNLQKAGYTPTMVFGDGLLGHAAGGPYDRIIATCTLRAIPPALLEQTANGGRIVAPFGSSFHSYSFLTLDVLDGTGQGRFSGRPAFMWARPHRGRTATIADVYHQEEGEKGSTDIDPRALDASPDAMFFLSLLVRDAWPVMRWADDGSDEATYWLLSDDRQSWATVEYVPGHDEFETDQYGPRRLWDEVEAAYRYWTRLESPKRERFGLTATAEGHSVWLDAPSNSVR